MNMTNKELKCFASDVLDLYCKTKIGEVEDVFIRLANIETYSFWTWLLKNEKVKNALKDRSTYDAFNVLGKLRNQFSPGQKLDYSTVIRTVYTNTAMIPIINEMNNLIDNNDVKDVLQPFRDIIELVATSIPGMEAVNKADILEDINVIRSTYLRSNVEEGGEKSQKLTIQQKRLNMVQYLLSRFSDDISMAAESSGMPELASAVRSGMLAKPITSGLNKFMDFSNIDTSLVIVCKKWAEYILKRPHYEQQWGDYNHDAIEMFLMGEAGHLTKEEIMEIISKYEQNTDPMKTLEEKDEDGMYEGLDTEDKITIDKRLNPTYIFLLSTFFVILRAKAGLPTGFAANIIH